MTDRQKKQISKSNRSAARRKKARRGGSNILIYIFLLLVIVSLFVALSFTVLFNASEIVVSGKCQHYTKEQIIDASGLNIGDNLIKTDVKSAAAKVESKLPYIYTAKVKRKFPNTFEINVAEAKADGIFSVNDKYALTCKGKVLEIVDEYVSGSTLYKVPIKQAKTGSNIVMDEKIKYVYDEMNNAIKNSSLDNITVVSFSSSVNIKLVYDNRLLLDIGTTENLEEKLKSGAKVVESVLSKYGDEAEGTINLKYLVDKNTESYYTQESIKDSGLKIESKQAE